MLVRMLENSVSLLLATAGLNSATLDAGAGLLMTKQRKRKRSRPAFSSSSLRLQLS